MKSKFQYRPVSSLAVALGLAVGLCLLSRNGVFAQSPNGNSNPGVVPPNAVPHGLTYGEWSAQWWKWALEKSTADSPILDTTGENCNVGQSGSVWFLAGTFGTSSPVTRSCTVAPGKTLFFPVADSFCAAEGDFVEMRKCAQEFMDGATDLQAEIDGEPVQDLDSYRVLSPEFKLELPDDNIFGVPAGIYEPAASDGVFLMLAPLQAGFQRARNKSHTIRFHARFPDSEVDVTYYITVER